MSSSPFVADKFTLIVPTFNRPAELARLLAYLAGHRVSFPILVLDSSTPDVQHANRVAVEANACNITLKSFDSSVSPWEKFWQGSKLVETDYCSLCADDDLIMPGSLDQIVQFLEANADHAVAHGWYFTFYDNVHIGITASVYRAGSLNQEDPVERLFELFKNYEAVTYGVYRTAVMRSALGDVQDVGSMLGKELLGGALSVVHGKTARLPIFYYGRSHAPSHPYMHWHPLDFLISSPEKLYSDYGQYRRILLACFSSTGYTRFSQAELATIVDLIHFRYLADYVKPAVMEFLVEQAIARTPRLETMQGMWSVLARENDKSVSGIAGGSWWIRRIRDRFFPKIRAHHLKRHAAASQHRTVNSHTPGGRPRDYLFYSDFLASLKADPALEKEIDAIVLALNCYE